VPSPPSPPGLPPVPPLTAWFIPRPETGQAAAAALVPGATVVLVSDRGSGAPATTERVAAGAREWPDSCGKTQLAISLATSLRESGTVELVIWATATSRASVLSAYMEAAAALGLRASGDAEAVAARLLGWLQEARAPWLVILDDVTEAAAVDRLWPTGPAGRVLATTTSPAAVPRGHVAAPVIVPVGTYSRREALAYLMGRLAADLDQRQGAADLVNELGDEPLALVQASSVIATSELSCRGYLDHLTARREMVSGAGGAVSPAAVTWALSVEHAVLLAGDLAHPQLTFAALLDGAGIPGTVFTASGREYSIPESAVYEGLSALAATGLLSVDTTLTPPMVRVNWVVQAAIRAACTAESLSGISVAAADAMLAEWPGEDQPEWLVRAYRSCANTLRRVAGDALWRDECHGLLLRAGQSLDALPAPAAAVEYWSDLAVTSDRVLGADHPHNLMISEHLARAYMAAGRPSEAISWFQWVKGDRASRLGLDSAATADASRDLGQALLAAGRPGEAVPVLTEAVASYDHVMGTDSMEAMGTRDDLVSALRATGQYSEAVWLGKRVLADREKVQGGKHPDTLSTAQQLAEAYLADGQTKAAISLLKRVVTDREKVLGPRDPATLTACGALAGANHSAGKMAAAVQLYEQVRAGYAETLGLDHRLTLSAGLNLAHAQYAVGRLSDGSKLLRETAERCELHLPGGDPLTASALESLRNISGPDGQAGAGKDGPGKDGPGQDGPGSPAGTPATDGEPQGGFGRRVTGRHRNR
jgi:tetratricopeptide (TPR) repeat protein